MPIRHLKIANLFQFLTSSLGKLPKPGIPSLRWEFIKENKKVRKQENTLLTKKATKKNTLSTTKANKKQKEKTITVKKKRKKRSRKKNLFFVGFFVESVFSFVFSYFLL